MIKVCVSSEHVHYPPHFTRYAHVMMREYRRFFCYILHFLPIYMPYNSTPSRYNWAATYRCKTHGHIQQLQEEATHASVHRYRPSSVIRLK